MEGYLQKVREAVRAERSARNLLKERDEEIAELREKLKVATDIPKHRAPSAIPKRGIGKGDVCAAIVASDWHWEEDVRPGTVDGLNEYSVCIAAARMRRMWQKGLWLCDVARSHLNVNELVVALLGDLITGQLREEALETSSMSPTRATFAVFDAVSSGLRFLRDEGKFPMITVVCASGNHGRDCQKPRSATRVDHSYEWILYAMLARELSSERMRFVVEEGYHVWHPMAGHAIRWHHGDKIRYHGGVGGISIPVNKAIAAWNRARPAELDVFGHWHTSIDGGSFMANGSGIGYNAYAVDIKAPFEPPQQTWFLVDRQWGVTMRAPIFLEDKP